MLSTKYRYTFLRNLIGICFGLASVSCAGNGTLSGESEQNGSQSGRYTSTLVPISNLSGTDNSQIAGVKSGNSKDTTASEDEKFQDEPYSAVSTIDTPNGKDTSKIQTSDRKALLNEWCQGARQTKLVNSKDELKSILSNLCNGDFATDLLTSKLIDRAYDGKNEIVFEDVTPATSPNSRLAELTEAANTNDDNLRGGGGGGGFKGGALAGVRLAYALKLPLATNDVFGRYQAGIDEANIKAKLEATSGIATVKSLNQFQNDGPSHVRGTEFFQSLTIGDAKDKTAIEANARIDAYKLPGTDLYMFTGTLTKPIKLLGKDDSIGAIISIGGSTYIVAVQDLRLSASGSKKEMALKQSKKLIEASAYETWRGITSRAP